MAVIATAGHVDHGKSALIESLTGRNPDRLKEELVRGMTIDLGFGCLKLPDGRSVGVVDVPGHRDFLENMLAGMAGLDLVLLVIAADEGVMPQTREHLAIIDLLGIPRGIVVFTKADLVCDEVHWMILEDDLRDLLAGTRMESAPWVRFSVVSGQGREELIGMIQAQLQASSMPVGRSNPRLAVDRVFTLAGFGTIVTGTLTGGSLRVGMEAQLQPSGFPVRIRGLQMYHQPVESVSPGNRVAVNLAGVSVDQVRRGDVLGLPGSGYPSMRMHARVDLSPGAARPLKHLDELKLFVHSAETIVKVRLLEGERISPGMAGLVELECRSSICVESGDRFIVRRPSPPETIGGGLVIRPAVVERARRHDARLLAHLAAFSDGSLEDQLLCWMSEQIFVCPQDRFDVLVDQSEVLPLLDHLLADGRIVRLTDEIFLTHENADDFARRMCSAVEKYHRRNPLSRGIWEAELRHSLEIERKPMNALLAWLTADGRLALSEEYVHLPGFQVVYTRAQRSGIDQLLEKFSASPFHPPMYQDAIKAVGEKVVKSLLEFGTLVLISQTVLMRSEDWNFVREMIMTKLRETGEIRLGQVRDALGTSRKFAQAMLECLDLNGEITRVGEYYQLNPQKRTGSVTGYRLNDRVQ